MPQSPQQLTNSTSVINNWKSKLKKHKKILITVLAVILLILIWLFLASGKDVFFGSGFINESNFSKDENLRTSGGDSKTAQIDNTKPEGAIAKVGEEYIFRRDLDYELSFQPAQKTLELEKKLFEKLISDSVVLQSAKKEALVELGNTEFNLEAKDYQKRIDLINTVKSKVNSRVDHITGTMVSVWFHNMHPAKIGLEQGKAEAFKRITALRTKVVKNEMTIKEAGESIKNDPSYEELDFGYLTNALISFSSLKGKRFTVDDNFDAILWRTPQGGVTEVYLGKNKNGLTMNWEEAYYIFGQVDEKVDKGNTEDYIKWVENQKKNYEISYY